MQQRAIYLEPLGRLASPLTSDMFFGAVCWGMRQLGLPAGGLDTVLSAVHPPDFAFSGLFPFAKQGAERVRFYPKPLSMILTRSDEDNLAQVDVQAGAAPQQQGRNPISALQAHKQALVKWVLIGKQFSGIEYLSESLVSDVLAGRMNAVGLVKAWMSQAGVVQTGACLITTAECKRLDKSGQPPGLMTHISAQHNHTDRVRGSTAEGLLFQDQETVFAPGAGLWCLATAEPARWPAIEGALRYLADTGFGANRTAGKGQFRITWEAPPQIGKVNKPTGVLCLSHYIPAPGELNVGGAPLAYKVAQVWAKRERKFAGSAPLLKRPVRMLVPGSVIPFKQSQAIYGRLAEVAPPDKPLNQGGWPIYQSGVMVALEGML